MIAFFVITILFLILYWVISRDTNVAESTPVAKQSTNHASPVVKETDADDVLVDEYGKKYKLITIPYELPRKTFILGSMKGKYWGELDADKDQEFQHSSFYDFNIYEVQVQVRQLNDGCKCISETKANCEGIHKEAEGAFEFVQDSEFPKGRLPQQIPCSIAIEGVEGEYGVSLHQPQLSHVSFIRKLHQKEGDEVFGTIEADITGYILDFTQHERTEKAYLETHETKQIPTKSAQQTGLAKTGVPTGKLESKNGYKRTEYFYSDYRTTYWGNWQYINTGSKSLGTEGCLSSVLGIVGGIIGIVFLLLLLPRLGILIPFIILLALLNFIPDRAWKWVLRVIAGIITIGFVLSMGNILGNTANTYVPKPVSQDTPEETSTDFQPIIDSAVAYDPQSDTMTLVASSDTLITHYRKWSDYDGNQFEGRFWVKKSAYTQARNFKSNLSLLGSESSFYDETVHKLKENDRRNLDGVYQLFDSIKKNRPFSQKQFAELIVSFIQDIPYSIVLPESCDPSLYKDDFVRKFLADPEALCDGYEKFGINTPVEFMATLKGDCDTRTLLLYTVLARYGYDVALLSSEYYSHSLLGINLPYEGVALTYNTKRYTLWETTSPNIKAGILPKEISNTNYWRISLKSK